MSVNYGKSKSYFDLKNGQLTLENVPVPPPTATVPVVWTASGEE
jgi:hypothetical protein